MPFTGMTQPRTVLGLCGSLRAASINHAVLCAAGFLAPPGVRVELYPSLAGLPLFNPDLDASALAPVAQLRERIVAADAVLISSPEYAHGVSGVIKNALDWLVGDDTWVNKPVAVLNTAPRSQHAHAALCETLRTMSARLMESACIGLPILGSGLDARGIASHAQHAARLRGALLALIATGTEIS
jgi:chromate reductase, NAD(P)H dehydrogenase (quinone)